MSAKLKKMKNALESIWLHKNTLFKDQFKK